MRESSQGAWVAVEWLSNTSIPQQQIALSEHIKSVCKCDSNNIKDVLPKLEEPNEDEWENELIEYYKNILEKMNCSNDEKMLLSCNKYNISDDEVDSDSEDDERDKLGKNL